jgi:hypothetical protein
VISFHDLLLLLLDQNYGTNFSYQHQCSVRILRPLQLVVEAIAKRNSCVLFCARPSTRGESQRKQTFRRRKVFIISCTTLCRIPSCHTIVLSPFRLLWWVQPLSASCNLRERFSVDHC